MGKLALVVSCYRCISVSMPVTGYSDGTLRCVEVRRRCSRFRYDFLIEFTLARMEHVFFWFSTESCSCKNLQSSIFRSILRRGNF